VDKERALDSELMDSIDQEMPSGQTKWTGVALIVGFSGCDVGLTCISAVVDSGEDHAEFLTGQGYLVVELYDTGATMEKVMSAIKILASTSTTKNQFLFRYDGHGNAMGIALVESTSIGLVNTSLNRYTLEELIKDYLGENIIFIYIGSACGSGGFTDELGRRLSWDENIKYVLLSCGKGTQRCAHVYTLLGFGSSRNFDKLLFQELKAGKSLKNAFEKVYKEITKGNDFCYKEVTKRFGRKTKEKVINCKREEPDCICQEPQYMFQNVNWESIFISR
jgi:hypothetical protein